ncbi:hypothetical protein KFL_004890130 [Klebsormidium nitens]|uniref:Uncharacterized protein n=1 Tax=Klebsormidium nitens TaxID=105231 RepID=A0A1Y1IDY2_KLENI|nr:hypothetical protein KFL_004890130 [Klebsormidium nitens]|eukprot:GAQ89130.1 hypothetical protein KFL_004890130 [Klebsormidium nitens]
MMDHKRDSRSQRFKNLQYKSRGRGQHHGQGHEVATDGAEGRTVGKDIETDEDRTKRSGANDRLGSNWDRYMEPGEADGAGTLDDGGVMEEVAKKQSEGLDYNLLLEEADALLSGGSVSLLAHFDLDIEDHFQTHDMEEKPLPLNINLSILNEALSYLSMAERLGLEDELLSSQEEEEGATIEALETDRAVELRDAGAYSKEQPPFREPVTATSRTSGVEGVTVDPTGSVAAALSVPKTSLQGKGQIPAAGTSRLSDGKDKAPESACSRTSKGEEARGARQAELSPSGQKEEDDADLLNVLLGRGGQAVKVTEGNGSIQGSGSARPAAKEEALPERRNGGAVGQSRGKLGTRPLVSGDSLLRPSGVGRGESAQAEPHQGTETNSLRAEAGRIGLLKGQTSSPAAREADEEAASHSQRGERASPADDDIDALLAALTPSASKSQAHVLPDRAASNGGATSVTRTGVASAGSMSAATPSERLLESTAIGSASQLTRSVKAESRPEQRSTAPVSARSKPTAPADEDFDAWLDSIS